jgi:hypothetical protein
MLRTWKAINPFKVEIRALRKRNKWLKTKNTELKWKKQKYRQWTLKIKIKWSEAAR